MMAERYGWMLSGCTPRKGAVVVLQLAHVVDHGGGVRREGKVAVQQTKVRMKARHLVS